MNFRHQNHPAYWAFVLHRISGLILALFLPIHFYILRLAVDNANAFDTFLAWTSNPLLAIAEMGLIILFTVHLTGGIRILALELFPWQKSQKNFIAISFGLSFFVGLAFLLSGL